MADAAMETLLEKLKHLLLYDAQLIKDAMPVVQQLQMDLRSLRPLLEDSDRKHSILQELVHQTRDVVYEAEDAIDTFIAQAAQLKTKSLFRRAVHKPAEFLRFSKQISDVTSKITSIHFGKVKFDLDNQEQEIPTFETGEYREDNVVGFEDEMDSLIGYLTEQTEQLDVLSIVGMPGIGKTTLAWKLFRHSKIQNDFPTLLWIHVSNNFTDKDIFLAILRKFNRDTDVTEQSAEELAQQVLGHLESQKFLIIMDDVRSTSDWDRIRIALPASNRMGKVLITTCNEEVGRYANRLRPPYKLRFLTDSESWSLLQLEAFGGPDRCPPELQSIGKLIAKQCEGLPLAVVLMGDILLEKDRLSSDLTARITAWIKACQDVPKYRNQKFYDDLPEHLQVCFLYFGMFPPDFEIPARKLICMWIAERFIRKRVDGVSLEETAENYLDDLINRHLVIVDKIRSNGKVKTCRIHHMLHDFCKIQAGKEGVLQEIKFIDGVFQPRISELPLYRRLCIHSNVSGFLSSKPLGARVRSLVSFCSDETNLPPEYISAISAAFELLRVLDVQPIIFSEIPNGMYQLVHLRYLTLSFTLCVLPVGFSKLWNMETLTVYTTSRTLEIKADIWKLAELRNFKTNASAILPKPIKTREERQNIQTLGTISPQSWTVDTFAMARKLKKLGIRGKLSSFFNEPKGSFECLGKLADLEKLKLINDVFPRPASEGRLQSLPPSDKFPPRLRRLTLANTFLDWKKMSILGSLDTLEVLKLKDKAFVGHTWVSDDDGGFRNLETLHVGRTDLVIWVASPYYFPRLRNLELHGCEKLQEVPIELADIPSLQRLDLFQTQLAAASAKRLLEKKQKYLEGRSNKVFKLSVYPPYE